MQEQPVANLEARVQHCNGLSVSDDYYTFDDTPNTSPGYGMSRAKSMGLFLASPFIALAYVVGLPFYGMYKIGSIAKEAYVLKSREKKELNALPQKERIFDRYA